MELNKQKEILKIAQKLIGFKTTANNPQELQKAIDYIKRYFKGSRCVVRKYLKNEKPSLVITFNKSKKPKIMLVTSIDIVEAKEEQFSPKIKKGRLYGAGAWGMKTYIALMMVLIKNLSKLKSPPSVGLMITSDEKVGSKDGTEYLLDKENYIPNVAFMPDGGHNFNLVNVQKGALHFKLIAKGKAAHGSRPWQGKNALNKIVSTCNRIFNAYPIPENEKDWKVSVNLGKIRGGDAVNKVADWAEAYLDVRHPEDIRQENILRNLKKLSKDCKLEVLVKVDPAYTPEDNDYLIKYKTIAEKNLDHKISITKESGGSDARFFNKKGIPTIITRSPGAGIHSDHEWIEIEPLKTFYEILKKYILSP